jgi:Zn-dependent protease
VEYLPPPSSDEPAPEPVASKPPPRRNWLNGLGTTGAVILGLALKFKLILLVSAPVWTFLLSLWAYVVFFGWQFAVVIMLLLLAHEFGHYFAFRAYGLPVKLPSFIPLLGAVTVGAIPKTAEQSAYIALAGPMTGLALAVGCYGMGLAGGGPFWYACATMSAFLNVFNMIPIVPFDGGRIVGSMELPALVNVWRGHSDPRVDSMTSGIRLSVAFWYLATTSGLVLLIFLAQSVAPGAQRAVPW